MTPSEKFFEVLTKYEYDGVEPLENWSTDDLVELQEAVRAELQERDRIAQNEYFDKGQVEEEWFIDEDWKCQDPTCACRVYSDFDKDDGGSYGGTA